MPANVLCYHANSGRKITLPDHTHGRTFHRRPAVNHADPKGCVHDFVVMPNHVHILMTVPGDMSLEKAMQLIKGGFSFRVNKELGFRGEIWQRGFSDVRIVDERSFQQHREYIEKQSCEGWSGELAGRVPVSDLRI
jgi:hypothetical protein